MKKYKFLSLRVYNFETVEGFIKKEENIQNILAKDTKEIKVVITELQNNL